MFGYRTKQSRRLRIYAPGRAGTAVISGRSPDVIASSGTIVHPSIIRNAASPRFIDRRAVICAFHSVQLGISRHARASEAGVAPATNIEAGSVADRNLARLLI